MAENTHGAGTAGAEGAGAGAGAAAAGNGAAAAGAGTGAGAGAGSGAPALPEKYSLSLGATSVLGPKATERLEAVAKALKLPSVEAAQSVLAAVEVEAADAIAAYEEGSKPGGARHAAVVKAMETEALNHPDVGGGDPVKLDRAKLRAGLLINEHAPGLKAALEASGMAVHPEFLAFANRIAAAFGERPIVTGAAAVTTGEPPLERRMFKNLDKVLAGPPAG